MTHSHRNLLGVLFLSVVPFLASSQKQIRGIVADSVSMENLIGVHCRSGTHSAVTDQKGVFTIMVQSYDTVTFSFVGYATIRVPIAADDDVMFVRMREESTILNEIVIRDHRLFLPEIIHSPTLSGTKPLRAASGGVNFAYFTKAEKEKRKLVKVLAELELARLYITIINEPSVREEIMKRFNLKENRYYELLANFNKYHQGVVLSNNEGVIMNSLMIYFKNATEKE